MTDKNSVSNFKIAGIDANEFTATLALSDTISLRYLIIGSIIAFTIIWWYYIGSYRFPKIGSPEMIGNEYYEEYVLEELAYAITAIELLGEKIISENNEVFRKAIFQQTDLRNNFENKIKKILEKIKGSSNGKKTGLKAIEERIKKINNKKEGIL